MLRGCRAGCPSVSDRPGPAWASRRRPEPRAAPPLPAAARVPARAAVRRVHPAGPATVPPLRRVTPPAPRFRKHPRRRLDRSQPSASPSWPSSSACLRAGTRLDGGSLGPSAEPLPDRRERRVALCRHVGPAPPASIGPPRLPPGNPAPCQIPAPWELTRDGTRIQDRLPPRGSWATNEAGKKPMQEASTLGTVPDHGGNRRPIRPYSRGVGIWPEFRRRRSIAPVRRESDRA